MPGLDAYAALAPFQIEELVDAANSILRDRPRLTMSKRTVRYYVAQGVLPAPRGAPKFARYGMEHLARIVGARVMQDEGRSLEEAAEALGQAFRKGEAAGVAQVQSWLVSGSGEERDSLVRESAAHYDRAVPSEAIAPRAPLSEPNRLFATLAGRDSGALESSAPVETLRYELTRHVVLEVRKGPPVEYALQEALEALEALLQTTRKNY